jgi:hypothetical protein
MKSKSRAIRGVWGFPHTFILLIGLAFLTEGICAEQNIEIEGLLESANYNPQSGEAHLNTKAHSTFVARLSGAGWSVSVTNLERGITWWAQRLYDGSNTYVLRPSGGGFYYTNPPNPHLQLATISPSAAAITLDADPLGAALVSITYGLSPLSFSTNQTGFVEMPLPWTVVRDNPDAYGFKWVIHASEGGRFLQDFAVFREKALDLPERDELLRPQLDYPETLPIYQDYMKELRMRRASPQGYRRAQYACTAWYHTNNLVLPKAAKLEVYLPPIDGSLPGRIWNLQATNMTFRAGTEGVLPKIAVETAVADYRYKRGNEARIFKYAEYTLKPGDSWRSAEDPELLAKAEEWLKLGQERMRFTESAYLSEAEAEEREATNKPAAQWETTDIEGKKHSLSDYRGKVVVLDFWYSGCVPCIKAMPEIKEIAEQFRANRLSCWG